MKKIIILILFSFLIISCSKNNQESIESLDNNDKILIPINTEIESGEKDETINSQDIIEIISVEENNFDIEEKSVFILKNLDFETDDSLTKFLNDKVSFNNLSYVPENLEKILSQYVLDSKGNQTARKEVVEALEKMSRDFYDYFGVKISVVSAYRSYSYQKGIKDRGCSDLFCAKAGYSEHQSGLALDFFEATSNEEFLSKKHLSQYFTWLKNNAHKYGFHNSYQNGREIDGYAIEPWHWRYLGVDFSTYLHQENITFAQYYNNLKAKY
ncbi:MAG: M15 family metallopeptidase [Candidatus Gracilibacteria bacterium]|nr:M15 family metallopeptidase [Candidatus Gracilibacteria bacterium]